MSWRPPPFAAPAWVRGPHLQTIVGKALRPRRLPAMERERWPTPDGDVLLLDLHDPPELARRGSPLAVVLHGLEGHTRRPYVGLVVHELARRGVASVALNFRGCGGEPNRLPRSYHSGETGDLAFVVEELRARFPDRPLAAIGASLGGNVLLKYLAERGASAVGEIVAAAAVSVPYDLDAGARVFESTPMGRVYAHYFLTSLREKVRQKRPLLEGHVDLERVLSSRTIREFDDHFTAPLHGFRDAAEYYRLSSSGPRVSEVAVPTLLLHAFDDPFLPADAVPVAAARANPAVRSVFLERGGHLGFVHGTPWSPRFHAERTVADFVAHWIQ